MKVFYVHLRNDIAHEDLEVEQHAHSEAEARQTLAFKWTNYRILKIKEIITPNHEFYVQVATKLVNLARQSKRPQVQAIALFSKPIADVAVHIKEAVVRKCKKGETSFDDIASAIFEQILPS